MMMLSMKMKCNYNKKDFKDFNNSILNKNKTVKSRMNNKYISGALGSGKALLIKAEIKKSFLLGNINIVIDQYNEYKELCESLGGMYIDFKNGKKIGINPLELNIEINEEGQEVIRLNEKIEELTLLLSNFFKECNNEILDDNQIDAISIAIRNSYAEKGILYNEDSEYKASCLYEEINGTRQKKRLPTLSDIKRNLEIESKKIHLSEELSEIMNIITGDGMVSFFDCETDKSRRINNEENLIFFSLDELDSFSKKFVNIALLNWISGEYFFNSKFNITQKNIWMDKIEKVIQTEENLKIVKRFITLEKKSTSIIIVSDDTNRFLSTKDGRTILEHCDTKYLFRQQIRYSEENLKYIGISKSLYDLIPRLIKGEYIIISNLQNEVVQTKLI